MVEETVQGKAQGEGKQLENMTLDELDEFEDEEDDRILLQYRCHNESHNKRGTGATIGGG